MLVQLTGFRVQGSRFKVQGSRFKVQGSRFKVLLDAGSMRHARRKAYSRNSNSPLETRNSKLAPPVSPSPGPSDHSPKHVT